MSHPQGPNPSPAPAPATPAVATRQRRGRTLAVATVAGTFTLLGVGAMAAAAVGDDDGGGGEQAAVASVDDCGYRAVFTTGSGAAESDASLVLQAEEQIAHDGRRIVIVETADEVSVGAMVGDAEHLVLTAEPGQTDVMVDLIREAIDHEDDMEIDEGNLSFEFTSNECALPSEFGEFEAGDFFNGDSRVVLTDGDDTCEFSSVFGDDGFDIEDIDFGDLRLDFDSNDDGFSISLATGDDEVALGCTEG